MMVAEDTGLPAWWRCFAILVGLVLTGAACSASEDEQNQASPSSVVSAPVTTTISVPTSVTVATTAPSVIERSAYGSYVVPTLGFVQSILPGGGGFVVSDGVQVCIEFVDGSEPECFPWQEGGQGRTNLITDWEKSGVKAAFFDRLQVAATFESPVWILDTSQGEVSQLLDADEVLAYDVE